jgi:putative FmdB family regulatory protein
MPIYEYYCPHCHRIFSFLAKTMAEAERTPECPKCNATDMTKKVSSFAFVGGTRKSSGSSGGGGNGDDMGLDDDLDPRAERELEKLMAQAENIDENDPRQLGGLMRKMAEVTGEPMDAEMEEAVRRLEKGEDPEKIEEEMGALFDDDGDNADGMGGGGFGGAPSVDDGLYSF